MQYTGCLERRLVTGNKPFNWKPLSELGSKVTPSDRGLRLFSKLRE